MSISQGIEVLKAAVGKMPDKSGVYRMVGAAGELLYIGKAKSLPKRVVSYAKAEGLPYRLQRMVSFINSVEFTVTKNEAEALLLEANLVREHQPKYNILLKDDKSFPYILLTADKEFNMLLKYRGRKTEKGEYFGPFPSAAAVNETLSVLQKAFPLRSCSDAIFNTRHRPCLEYQIKRCTAPCVGKIAAEDYNKIAAEARLFLRGKSSEVQKTLAEQMQTAADKLDYEKAAQLRDRIKALTKVQSEKQVDIAEADVIALYREGDKACIQIFFIRAGQNYGNRAYFPTNTEGAADGEVISSFIGQFYQTNKSAEQILVSHEIEDVEVLEEALGTKIKTPKRLGTEIMKMALANAKQALQQKLSENAEQEILFEEMAKTFGLAEVPERIEVYDNSHNQGSAAVGAMIVATRNGFDKKAYRKFNIKIAQTNDDFAMMREVLTRRFSKDAENFPDVALIDGGAGQLSASAEALANLGVHNVTLIAIAKGELRNAGNEEYHMVGRAPFRLPKGSALAFFMQRIRDESHRYVIGTHRAKRAKELVKSELDAIEGVGAFRKKKLLHHFGSVLAIRQASIEDIKKVEGVSQKTAEIIYNYFH